MSGKSPNIVQSVGSSREFKEPPKDDRMQTLHASFVNLKHTKLSMA